MKFTFLNRSLLLLSALVVFGIGAFFVFAGTSDNLSGYAWSENIGWISFNCTNSGTCGTSNYGVNIAENGDLSGYAWSENIGWISFNASETSGCPSVPCAPILNRTQQRLEGWARALAADNNGWDGWIHLSAGLNYGATVSGCAYDGYAWGSDVVGWIHFRGTNYGVSGSGSACGVFADAQANGSDNPISIAYNASAIISWTSLNASDCSVSPTGWSGTSGSQSTGPLTSSQTYTVTCNGAGGTFSNDIIVNVSITPLTASCIVFPNTVKAGQLVAWSASPSGGIGSYTFAWSGAPDPNPLDGHTENPAYISYTTIGVKTGSVEVTSGAQNVTVACSNSADITPGIFNFTASDLKITLNQSVILSWSSTGFSSCDINQGVGSVPVSGSRTVTPLINTTYTLTCTGSGGVSDSRNVTITVLQEPEFIEVPPK
jgi:hypothetical protein